MNEGDSAGDGFAEDEPFSSKPRKNVLPDAVKNLGRKARARLDEERSKRREIQRVDIDVRAPDALLGVTTNRSAPEDAATLVPAKKVHKPSSNKKRRRRSNASEDDRVVEDRNVDRWIPDISHIPLPTTSENQSSVVPVHGLPAGTTAAQIRRFFSGLDPRRVFILPSSPLTLADLDARSDIPRKVGLRVDRCEHHLRVLVKFHSAPTAALAAQRSGEVMRVAESKGASVAVTHLLKNTASYFVKKLAVIVEPVLTVDSMLNKIESNVDPLVPTLLWEAAIKELKMKTVVDYSDSAGSTFRLDRLGNRPRQPASHSDTTELRQHRAALQQQVHRLLNTPPFPAAEALDPALRQTDPILTLTSNCVGIIEAEIEKLDTALAVAARWHFLVATRPPRRQFAGTSTT